MEARRGSAWGYRHLGPKDEIAALAGPPPYRNGVANPLQASDLVFQTRESERSVGRERAPDDPFQSLGIGVCLGLLSRSPPNEGVVRMVGSFLQASLPGPGTCLFDRLERKEAMRSFVVRQPTAPHVDVDEARRIEQFHGLIDRELNR